MVLLLIEIVWNIFPSRSWTSVLLWVLHLVLLFAVLSYQWQTYRFTDKKLKTHDE